ncbi:hypothetical protein [Viridibacterium curvum]|uniref:Pectate lyase n=1 Tax=Viridibacterium curvum TaxID=1101404 RepID=A0ABP9QHQ1_9RHOO
MRTSLTLFVALMHLPGLHAAELIGFGTDTRAGSGGEIIRVTTLDGFGSGSLREALLTQGPRIIVFEVGGVIDLEKTDLKIRSPFVTIAGQTAPSPGITLIRGGMNIGTHDVLMQHIRFRIGDAGMAKKSGFERDVSITGPNARNVVVDHCSFAWGTDENLSVSGERYYGPQGTAGRVTLSNNIVAEGLLDATHEKGKHSMGSLIHDNVQEVAIIGNLYAHNRDRNPWYKTNATGVVVNNLIYNPGDYAVRGGGVPSEWSGRTMPANTQIAVVGNVLRHGPNTRKDLALLRVGANDAGADAFLSDNLAFDRKGEPMPMTLGKVTPLDKAPLWPAGLVARPAADTEAAVLRSAGARPRDRDAVDARIVAEAQSGGGRIIDSQEEIGGYPRPESTRRKLDIPKDVDAWLKKLAADLE